MEHRSEYALGVAIAIILIIAPKPRDLCWPAPAMRFLQGHSGVRLSPQPDPAQARQFV